MKLKNDFKPTNPGKRFREIFHGVVQPDGRIDLVSDGFEDTQKLIEADAVGASLPEIIERALRGDVSVFRDEGFYGDVTQMPTTYAEILNSVNNGKAIFEKLDIETKRKFDNNFEKWFATMNSKEWFDNMGMIKKVEESVEKESEVKE